MLLVSSVLQRGLTLATTALHLIVHEPALLVVILGHFLVTASVSTVFAPLQTYTGQSSPSESSFLFG